MSLIAKAGGAAKEFELVPQGTMVGRLFSIIDLGTTRNEKYEKDVHKVRIAWETSETMPDGKPFAISKTYIVSVHEKSQLRKDVEAMLNRKLSKDEEGAFEIKSLLGTYCMLQIVHVTHGEKTYANIQTVMAVNTKMVKLFEPVNSDIIFEFQDDAQSTMIAFDNLADWQKEMVKKAKEYSILFGGAVKPEVVTKNFSPNAMISFVRATELYNSTPENKRAEVLAKAGVNSFFELTEAQALNVAPF